MTKEEIITHPAYKFISSLSPTQRYETIFYKMKSQIEAAFKVKISEASFTYLNESKQNEICLSCKKDSQTMIMAVLTPI